MGRVRPDQRPTRLYAYHGSRFLPGSEEIPTSMAAQPIGFIVALPAEAPSLTRQRVDFDSLLPLPEGHWLAISGAGPDAAHEAATRLLAQGTTALVSWGCAAALAPDLKPGALVIPNRILGAKGDTLPVSPEWRGRLVQALTPTIPVIDGALQESRRIVATPAEKHALHLGTHAVAVDMESAAIARVAQRAQRPFLAVRVIADSAQMPLPAAVAQSLNPRGDVRMGDLLRHLVRHPGQIPELIRLGQAFGAALKTLRRVRALSGADCRFSL